MRSPTAGDPATDEFMVSFCRKSTSIRFARNTVSALPAVKGPDSYAKLATLATPTESPANVPPDAVG